MLYDVQFFFHSDMTIGEVNELIDKIGSELDGSVSTAEYWIDSDGFYIYANFDYDNTRPKAIVKWAKEHDVMVKTGLED